MGSKLQKFLNRIRHSICLLDTILKIFKKKIIHEEMIAEGRTVHRKKGRRTQLKRKVCVFLEEIWDNWVAENFRKFWRTGKFWKDLGEIFGKKFKIIFWNKFLRTLNFSMLQSRDQIWEHLWSHAADDEIENILTWEQQKRNFYGSIREEIIKFGYILNKQISSYLSFKEKK